MLRSFSVASPWMQAAFMLEPEDSLGGKRSLDVLKAGEADAVVDEALAYGEHGAR